MTNMIQSAGILVLGMHRSGTSALARVLQAGGANMGRRVLGGSGGNEAGHWEDAFAVECHDRLLAALGARWDEPFSLPTDWAMTEPAARARADITRYLADDRASEVLWALKDPRASLFASLWTAAAADVGLALSIVVMARHPLEVAASLQTRDGIEPSRALLLWLDYTISALQACSGSAHALVSYEGLLQDWRAVAEKIGSLPGADVLSYGDGQSRTVESFLDRGLRHHHGAADEGLPHAVRALWLQLESWASDGQVTGGAVARMMDELRPIRELVQPFVVESRVEKSKLWERVARAEHGLGTAMVAVAGLPDEVSELRARGDRQHEAVVDALSTVLRGDTMEGIRAAVLGVRELRERVDAQHSQVIESVSRVLRDDVMEAMRGAAADVRELRERVDAQHSQVIDAVSRILQDDALEGMRRAVAMVPELGERIDRQHAVAIGALDRELATARLELERMRQSHDAVVQAQRIKDGELLEANANIVAVRRECEALMREKSAMARESAGFRLIVQSRSWRWTRPLRVLRRMLSSSSRSDEVARIRRTVGQRMGWMIRRPDLRLAPLASVVHRDVEAAHGGALRTETPEPKAGAMLPDVYFWAVIDWHFRTQRPQHLARALAQKGHRVFYVSNNFVDSSEPGYMAQPLDEEGRLFQVHLHLQGAPAIYHGMPSESQVADLHDSLARLLGWTGTGAAVSIVQHPFWAPLSRSVPNVRWVYDCMDHHGGFGNNSPQVLLAEESLVTGSDLVVVTSSWLEAEVGGRARNTATIRNGADHAFFRGRPPRIFKDPAGRKVVGYFGAIAEWFDVDLLRQVAQDHPRALFLILGADTVGAASALAEVTNIEFTGELPYEELPYYLHGFHVCLLPFKVLPLTLATNPVKVYEYLSAGKPVVSVDLPELAQFDGLVEVASSGEAFSAAVGRALELESTSDMVEKRQAFASQQTWLHRATALDTALERLHEPPVSVIILTYNNLALTKECLFSIDSYSDYTNLEIVVVDNASSDGSREWLSEWVTSPSSSGARRKLILNERNVGFSAGNNVGLREASGDYLVVLNNDTYVTPGWLRTLCAHLRRDPRLGLVGPVTNNIGNEARIEIEYADMVEMIHRAGQYTRAHPGKRLRIDSLAFFCAAMPRLVYEKVGPMDEEFGLGFFEDDDYCRRVQAAGFEVACAEDVFVHHHLSASFDKLGSESKRALFERNKAIYEAKWGAWKAHVYRR